MKKHIASFLCVLFCAPAIYLLAHDDDFHNQDLLYDRQQREWQQNEYESGRNQPQFDAYYHHNDYPGSRGSNYYNDSNYNYDGDPYNGY